MFDDFGLFLRSVGDFLSILPVLILGFIGACALAAPALGFNRKKRE